MASADESSVRVALRIRPPIARELIDDCQLCTSVTPNLPQVWIGGNYAFTYDYVFDINSTQESVFETARGLIDGCLDGYNATILAYGQTGSGKTYTMGTAFDVETHHSVRVSESQGIIPRAVHYLFNSIHARREEALTGSRTPPEFTVTAQFVELYNEEVIDLIDPDLLAKTGRKGPGTILIREDPYGGIYLVGVGSKSVLTAEDAMNCLHQGALSRTTATTNMNDQSSRSHAIFTLHIKQQRVVHSNEDEMDTGAISSELETLTAKFHFVDLAGSERLKRTGAVGDRAKEGISINSGLLSLGNVISALGDRSKKALHIPYRDSKLTRLLQDSLGGNSRTLVIACVSPCDRDFLETLNTLKYANRARNIKNRVTINQDKSSSQIAHLRAEIQQLQLELQEFKQGKRAITNTGDEIETDTYHENILLLSELTTLKGRIKAMQSTIDTLTAKNVQLLAERETGTWNMSDNKADLESHFDFTLMIQNYLREIEVLSAKLCESEATCQQLRRKIDSGGAPGLNSSLSPRPIMTSMTTSSAYNDYETVDSTPMSVINLIDEAKKEVQTEEKVVKKLMRLGRDRTRIDDEEIEEEESSDEEMEDSSDEEEPTEAGVNIGTLAQLTNEISTKQRLIDQLELSHKRLEVMKAQYEEKLMCLSSRIRATEEERDKVLSSMNQHRTAPQGKINQVKEDYEKKLIGMQSELKKLQTAHKEHQKVLRSQGQADRQMQSLRVEIENMKRVKVKLMNQLKDENTKRRDMETQRNKEIVQLKKSQRKKDIVIRTLETQNRMKEQVLKRKHEEVNALKKQSRTTGIGRKDLTFKSAAASTNNLRKFSPVKAKSKWTILCSSIMKTVSLKQTVDNLANDLDRQYNERKQVKLDLQMLIEERNLKQKQMASPMEINAISDQIDSTVSTLAFLDDKINDHKQNIVELEIAIAAEEEEGSISRAVSLMKKEESGYIMEKMYQLVMDELTHSSNCTKSNTNLERDNLSLHDDNKVMKEILMYAHSATLMNNLPPDLAQQLNNIRFGLPVNLPASLESKEKGAEDDPNGIGTVSYTSSSSTVKRNLMMNGDYDVDEQLGQLQSMGPPATSTVVSNKSRRLTASRNELMEDRNLFLFNGRNQMPTIGMDTVGNFRNPNELEELSKFSRTSSFRGSSRFQRRGTYTLSETDQFGNPNGELSLSSLPVLPVNPGVSRVNSFPRKMLPRDRQGETARSSEYAGANNYFSGHQPSLGNLSQLNPNLLNATYNVKGFSPTKQMQEFDTTFLNDCTPENSPPGSPSAMRRSVLGADVFQRLTSSMTTSMEPSIPNGLIRPTREKGSHRCPLIQTHVADGHSKPVLSIYATEQRLFTGAKDAIVKVWDLGTGVEIQTLSGHPSSVSCVRYLEDLRIVLSASCHFIKVWDCRQSPTTCVKTLQSSGSFSDGNIHFDPNNRMHSVPLGESFINDIAMSKRSFALYTPQGKKVRVWDLRAFSSIGLLTTTHNAQVTCMASHDSVSKEVLVTGSKDHTLKVYEFASTDPCVNAFIQPRAVLDPPHYDGIESLCLSGSTLFSGSRDTCIKKWDLTECAPVNSINKAHSDYITGLTFAPKNDALLLSSSRDGYLKLWCSNTCQELGKVEAAKGGVYCVTNNSGLVFTGGHDGTVGCWRVKSGE